MGRVIFVLDERWEIGTMSDVITRTSVFFLSRRSCTKRFHFHWDFLGKIFT